MRERYRSQTAIQLAGRSVAAGNQEPCRARRAVATFGVIATAVVLLAMMMRPAAALAAESPCDGDPERSTTRPIAPVSVAAGLGEPFAYAPDGVDRDAVLADVVDVVRRQAAELGTEACYQGKPERIAARVDFLSPFEFLVVTLLDQDPARRDALLDQYAVDPRGAIHALSDAIPSTRAQATLATYAYFDVASGRIRVNVAKVPTADLRRVLVHEFWHAMPLARTWTAADGRTLRASGFWLQEQRAGRRVWVPVEDRQGLPYASYLLDEAMATLMETRYAGPSRFARPDIDEVRQFLDRLMAVAGPDEVMRQYLQSQPYQLGALTEAHRDSFPELEPIAQP
jgi:hypothetical protein